MRAFALELLSHAAALLFLPVAAWRGRSRSGYFGRFLRRLGPHPAESVRPDLAPAVPGSGPTVVVNACSVGENLAIFPLFAELREKIPGVRIVHTVTTETGFALARKKSTADRLEYVPADVRPAVRGFLDRHAPALFIAVETELWPVLFLELERRGIPLALVNGRISDRSFPRYRAFGSLTRRALAAGRLFLMQSAEDAGRIIALGADPRRTVVPGNLKFDSLEPVVRDPAPRHAFRFGPADRVFVLGSIHPGEEAAALALMRAIGAVDPRVRFLLAPRKLERLDETLAALKAAGVAFERWSETRGSALPPPGLLVLDTIGELVDAYRMSVGAFVGGSFIDVGGHNILEVSACGKPVFFGPRMHNFREFAALALDGGFGRQYATVEQAAADLGRLFAAPDELSRMGESGRAALLARVGATRRTAHLLAGLLVR